MGVVGPLIGFFLWRLSAQATPAGPAALSPIARKTKRHNRSRYLKSVFLERAGRSVPIMSARRLRAAAGAVPPTGLVLLSILSVQLGAAVAKNLFPALGPAGAVLLRVGVAALVLLVLWRPRLRDYTPTQYAAAALFGLTIAGMNLAFYGALDHIPLGVAVTLEFVGPLGVALAGSRRLSDLLWGALAVGGIALLAPGGAPRSTHSASRSPWWPVAYGPRTSCSAPAWGATSRTGQA